MLPEGLAVALDALTMPHRAVVRFACVTQQQLATKSMARGARRNFEDSIDNAFPSSISTEEP
jgi:hypothetical protein